MSRDKIKRDTDIDYKYVMVVPGEFYQHYQEVDFEVTGLLQWPMLYQRKSKQTLPTIATIDHDLTKYDVIHCNISSTELEYPFIARAQNPDATIIANLDFGISTWQRYFIRMDDVVRSLRFCDGVFSVEPAQRSWLEYILNRKVKLMMHPLDTESVEAFLNQPKQFDTSGVFDESKPVIATQWREYDNNHILPLELLRRNNLNINTILFGVKMEFCRRNGILLPTRRLPVSADTGKPPDGLQEVSLKADDGWTTIFPFMKPDDYYRVMNTCDLGIDLRTTFSAARWPLDCALTHIPCIATPQCYSAQMLYPKCIAAQDDPNKIITLVKKLSNPNHPFYKATVNHANNIIKSMGFDSALQNMNELINAAEANKKTRE